MTTYFLACHSEVFFFDKQKNEIRMGFRSRESKLLITHYSDIFYFATFLKIINNNILKFPQNLNLIVNNYNKPISS